MTQAGMAMSSVVVKFSWKHRQDEENAIAQLLSSQTDMIRQLIELATRVETDVSTKDYLFPFMLNKLLNGLLSTLEKMLHGRPQASSGELIQLLGGFRQACSGMTEKGHMEVPAVPSMQTGAHDTCKSTSFVPISFSLLLPLWPPTCPCPCCV